MEDTQQPESRREGNLARQSSPVRLIIRHKQPSNLETPFDQLDSFVTPLELFYIRSHFLTPEIELASRQTSDYAYSDYAAGNPVRRALGEVKPKSEIARPRAYERVSPNQSYTAFGATWARETVITWIEVSTDAGRTWADAEFIDDARQYAWRRWKFASITPKEPGQYTLLARSRGADGGIQPNGHDENYASYVINHSLPIEVFVEHPASPSVNWTGSSRPTT